MNLVYDGKIKSKTEEALFVKILSLDYQKEPNRYCTIADKALIKIDRSKEFYQRYYSQYTLPDDTCRTQSS